MSDALLADVDHLVWACPDLETGIAAVRGLTGCAPVPGGAHPGLGTRNALLGLGSSYLEVIAPDPGQGEPASPRPFGIDGLDEGRLVAWAVRAPGIEARVAAARASGYDPGAVRAMSRRTPEGERLEWSLTLPAAAEIPALVPFLIDWGTTPHPASRLAPGCRLLAVVGRHPSPHEVKPALAALAVALAVRRGPETALEARLATPRGEVFLS